MLRPGRSSHACKAALGVEQLEIMPQPHLRIVQCAAEVSSEIIVDEANRQFRDPHSGHSCNGNT